MNRSLVHIYIHTIMDTLLLLLQNLYNDTAYAPVELYPDKRRILQAILQLRSLLLLRHVRKLRQQHDGY